MLLAAVCSATVATAGDAGHGQSSGRSYLHVPSWTRAADLVVLVVVRSCERHDGQLRAAGRVAEVLKGKWNEPDIEFGVAVASPVGVTGLAFLMQENGGLVSLDSCGVFGAESPLLVVQPAPLAGWPTTGLARARQLLMATAEGGASAAQRAAVDQLGYLAVNSSTTALLERLSRGGDVALRGVSVAALLRLGAPGAISRAADFIAASRGDSVGLSQWANVLGELGAMAAPADTEGLIRLANEQEPMAREAAAQALGQTLDPQAIPVLIRLLEDQSQAVRAKVIEALSVITAKPGRGIRIDYAAKEGEYLDYWRQWWRTEGQLAFAAPAAEGRP
ncbi:MAG: HEAT repeat domain-containing protein [Armatimonadetes bacterium]|nr:HEAT repeat domain-containing protein [Armatimonadota bacterium]